VLSESKPVDKVSAVILRVPLLYGHCEDNDPSKSAVHPLVDAVYKAQTLSADDAKIQVDDYGLRFPTCTEDVGSVLVDIAKKYTGPDNEGDKLPQTLQFSGQKQYTKWEMVKLFGEILGLPVNNLVAHDPSKEPQVEGATQRPYDSHLDVSVLQDLGIQTVNQDFAAWWYVTAI
jgi:S-adenosylmethionine synthetase